MTDANTRANEAAMRSAADWWTRLRDPEVSDEIMQQWLDWMSADTRHRDAFEQVTDLGLQFGSLHPLARRSLSNEFTTHAPTSRRRRLLLAAAAAIAALVPAGYLAWTRITAIDTQTYASAIAENREITLPDGTRVALGGASQLVMRFGDDLREVEVGAGEAFFEIAHDARRPFVVTAGPLTIRDIGTAFDVRRSGERVAVAITQGQVRVAAGKQQKALDAAAGQLVSYDPAAPSLMLGKVAAEQATAWRNDRLEFNNEPLGVVIANINRYSSRRIRVADAHLEGLTFTGTVRTDAIDAWLGALPHVFPLRIDRTTGEVVLSDPARKYSP